MQYTKTKLPDFLSVRSIITIFRADFSSYPISSEGESYNFCELKYIEKGSHRLLLDGKLFELNEGQMMIYAPLAHHSASEKSNALADIISFESDSEAISQLYNRVITLNMRQRQTLSRIVTDGENIFKATSADAEQVGMLPKDGTNAFELQRLKNQLELFFIDVYGNDSCGGANHRLYRVEQLEALVDYLTSHLDRNLTLDEIAKDCSMSVSKLKLICKEEANCSPISLFISLKIDEAKRMMTETSLNFTQIAEKLGFTSVHYFSKLFKKKTGLTPTEYARSVEHNKDNYT